MKFNDIETISQGVSDYLTDNKIVDMTEIQRQTYKHIMDNRDIIACSSTGTGKTLAYLIPIINRLKSNTHNIQAVILVPTAELAIHVFFRFYLLFSITSPIIYVNYCFYMIIQ